MSRMSWRAVPGPEGPALLAARGRDAALGTVVVVLTAGVFAAVGDHGTLTSIQRLDDAWLRLMIAGQAPPLIAIAKVFNVLGLVFVTLPARIAVAGLLALRRRWWQLAAFTAAVMALAPPGRRRAWWTLAAVAFSILMGLSRAYLGAHWLSDAVAGILLGISCAVVTALMIGQIQRRVEGRQGTA
jgi:membrane-associated phospholipid phosphatase